MFVPRQDLNDVWLLDTDRQFSCRCLQLLFPCGMQMRRVGQELGTLQVLRRLLQRDQLSAPQVHVRTLVPPVLVDQWRAVASRGRQ